jgi:2-pyrone-4,6-dicarboxylate lactonase
MSNATRQDPDNGLEPAFAAPQHACDAHFHIFGPVDKYRHVTYAPVDAYLGLAKRLGFERFVLVQPSAYGLDNSCMLDAMAAIEPARRRAIVQFDDAHPDDARLRQWHALGVCGARINISPIRQPEPGLADALRPKIVRTADICRGLGWHVDLLLPGWLIDELLPTLRDLPVARRNRILVDKPARCSASRELFGSGGLADCRLKRRELAADLSLGSC